MNIKELRIKLNLSQQGLADEIGIPKSRIGQWEFGKGKPKTEDNQKLINFFTKKGLFVEEVANSSANNESDYIKTRRKNKNSEPKPDTLMYYEIGAHAGTYNTGEILPVRKNEGVLRVSELFKGSQYALRISGNSMVPNYPAGAIIGIREIYDKQITPGSVYLIEKDNDLWIKRLFYKNDDQTTGVFDCISDNTMKYETGAQTGRYCYPPFQIAIDNVRRLFKVTGVYKPNELSVVE